MNDLDKQRIEEARVWAQGKADLIERIDKFLDVQVGDGCDFAPVSKDDIDQLDHIICDILKLRYKRDCDNWLPVRFELINRHTHFVTGFGGVKKHDTKRLISMCHWAADQLAIESRLQELDDE